MRTAEKLHYQRFTAIVNIFSPVSPDNVTAFVRSSFLFHFHIIVCIEYPKKPVYIIVLILEPSTLPVYNCFDIRTI